MPQIGKHVQLSEDNVEWFYATYGENASLSWLLDELLSAYIRELGEKTPAHYAELAAKSLKESVHDG